MSANDYYSLKKKGYFRKSFTYDEFLQTIQGVSQTQLPFYDLGTLGDLYNSPNSFATLRVQI